ncbi:MAG: TRL-like family protein [Candidatus Manganitrophaceae bacterium]
MKMRTGVLSLVLSSFVLGGCAMAPFPLTGFLYTEGKAPYHAVENATAGKSGKACATSILGIVATGDASIEAAMKAGGITKVAAVDYSNKSILGLWAEFCTIASGQ